MKHAGDFALSKRESSVRWCHLLRWSLAEVWTLNLDNSWHSSGAELPPYEIVWSKTSAAEAGPHNRFTLHTNAIHLTYFTFFVGQCVLWK